MPIQKSIGLVFDMPSIADAQPVSLLRLLSSSEVKPELGDKFRLALNLARYTPQLHLVKWSVCHHLKWCRSHINKYKTKASETTTSSSSQITIDVRRVN